MATDVRRVESFYGVVPGGRFGYVIYLDREDDERAAEALEV